MDGEEVTSTEPVAVNDTITNENETEQQSIAPGELIEDQETALEEQSTSRPASGTSETRDIGTATASENAETKSTTADGDLTETADAENPSTVSSSEAKININPASADSTANPADTQKATPQSAYIRGEVINDKLQTRESRLGPIPFNSSINGK